MPDTTAADLEVAAKEAEDAQARFLGLEYAALHNAPDKRPGAAEVVTQRTEAQHAALRVEITRKRLEEAKEAERRQACAELGERIGKFYDDTAAAGTLPVLARQAAEAIAALRAGISVHNSKVAALHREAGALETRPGRDGPRAEDSRVGRAGDGIRYGNKLVLAISGNAASYAVNHVVAGDLDAAVRELGTTSDCTPQPPSAVYRDTVDGTVYPVHDNRPRWLSSMISDGRAVPLTAGELDNWMAGYWQRDPA